MLSSEFFQQRFGLLQVGCVKSFGEPAIDRLQQLTGGGKRLRRIGMVAVARQLLLALGRFLASGGLPAGAVLQEAYTVGVRGCVIPRAWGWWRRPVQLPGLSQKPSERGGRLPQDFRLSSQDAESIGGRV